MTGQLAKFLLEVEKDRADLEKRIEARKSQSATVAPRFRNELEAVAASLGLAHLPSNVFEKLALLP